MPIQTLGERGSDPLLSVVEKGIRKGMLVEHNVISKEKESYNFCIVHRLGCCLAKWWESLAAARTKLQVSSIHHRPLQVTV